MKKNDHIELQITDLGVNGEGIGRYEECTFFVKDALPGDRVEAVVTKLKSAFGYAKMIKILEPSAHRVRPECPLASRCGGCQVMQLDYPEQLRLKEQKVRNNLERIGGLKEVPLRPIIGMPEPESEPVIPCISPESGIPSGTDISFMPLHFRNKMQFPVGRSKDGRTITGFYAGRTHFIIETEDCPVSAPETAVLLETIRRFIDENHLSVYDEETGKGLIRHVLIRNAVSTGQILVCLVINGKSLDEGAVSRDRAAEAKSGRTYGPDRLGQILVRELLAADLSSYGSRIAEICLNVNRDRTNVILGSKVIVLYGNSFIEERIGNLTFRISPLAFFQVNSIQTERLYQKALEYAGLTGEETVWDLYCGTGTISLFLAQKAGHVYGVEIIPEAIENAKENADLNHIGNASFYCGKSEEIFPEMCIRPDSQGAPDVVVLDPPRKGCDPALLAAILQTEPERIVYVSCDSATLARDIRILNEKYYLAEATPVDMFPHTMHVECVSLLQRMSNTRERMITLDVEMEDYHRIKNRTEVIADATE